MNQFSNLWAALDPRRKLAVLAATLGVLVSVVIMAGMASAPSMKLLYAGLENGAAGDVVRALEQRNIAFEVRGGSIYVPAGQRDELRLTLAGEGLPTNGGKGYELLDSLNGFGTTSQMFDAAYWRAKEGELARTIIASPRISQARVHIARGGESAFQRGAKATASVAVVSSGGTIAAQHAEAIRFLVASAVAGLEVGNVTVIDADGSVIGSADSGAAAPASEDRVQQLRERVMRLVEARVGSGNAVVEVSVDTETESESVRERRFDPSGRVAISTDVEERSDSSRNQATGVTVASNLPDGDAAGGDESNATASSTRERVNYEVSETELEIVRAPGSIKRVTVAVLVNGLRNSGPDGAAEFEPRPEAELTALRDLVASAVGFDAERGDEITIRSMDLPVSAPPGTDAAGASLWMLAAPDMISLLQMATLAVVALILGLFVIRPVLTRAARPDAAPLAIAAERAPAAAAEAQVLTGEIQEDREPANAAIGALSPGTPVSATAPALTATSGDAVERLRAMIGDRQEETVEILRSWIEENEEPV